MNLERADLLQVDPISSRGTLKLLPLGKKLKQKLLIGDDSGQISCYEFKKGEPQVVFQTKVFDGPISSLCLGGNPQKRDKIFLAHSQRIVGLTKKGKEFFKLTSTLTEPIRKIVVEDTRIWTGCENVYNLFDDGRDAAYFISRGQINDLVIGNVSRDTDFDTVLACQDKFIRIIRTSQLFLEIPLEYAATAVVHLQLERDISLSVRKPTHLVFGTAKGTLGMIQIHISGSFELLWEIDDGEDQVSINCLNLFDLNKDGVPEIILGRDDGRVEVYKIQADNLYAEPTRLFTKDIGQSVRAVECGVVNTPDFPEILVAAYSGKIISFTTEPIRTRATDDSYGRSIQTVHNENRIKSLRKEVDDMRKTLDKQREKLKKAQQTASASSNAAAAAAATAAAYRAPADFPVNVQFDLDTRKAAYTLAIELQSPIDLIVLRSPVVLDLVEAENNTGAKNALGGAASSSSLLSVTPADMMGLDDNNSGNSANNSSSSSSSAAGKFMAVVRCQNGERRLALNLRSYEGDFGEVTLTVVTSTSTQPTSTGAGSSSSATAAGSYTSSSSSAASSTVSSKAAKNLRFELKPLSLHSRVHSLTEAENSRPRHRIRYTGNFTSATAYEWLQTIFPDVPPRLDEDTSSSQSSSEQRFFFRHSFTSAVAVSSVRRGELAVEAESASVVAIVKEQVTRLANYRRTAVEEQISPSAAAISSFLELVRPKLDAQATLARRAALVDAVTEIAQQEPEAAWLGDEYRAVLDSQETIRREFKQRGAALAHLQGLVTDLFIDWTRIRGGTTNEARRHFNTLRPLLAMEGPQSWDFGRLLQFFAQSA